MTRTPNPGHPDAIGQGCVCPRVDNRNGTGSGPFWVNGDCPLHRTTLTFGSTMPAAPPKAAPAEPQFLDLTLYDLHAIAENASRCESCGESLGAVALRDIRRGERPNRLRHEVCS